MDEPRVRCLSGALSMEPQGIHTPPNRSRGDGALDEPRVRCVGGALSQAPEVVGALHCREQGEEDPGEKEGDREAGDQQGVDTHASTVHRRDRRRHRPRRLVPTVNPFGQRKAVATDKQATRATPCWAPEHSESDSALRRSNRRIVESLNGAVPKESRGWASLQTVELRLHTTLLRRRHYAFKAVSRSMNSFCALVAWHETSFVWFGCTSN